MNDDELRAIYEDLGGKREIAAHLGIGKHRLERWIDRQESTGCPQPVLKLTMGNIYSKAEWTAWFRFWWATRAHRTYIRKELRYPE